MRKSLIVLLLTFGLAACGKDTTTATKISEIESRNEELNQRVAKLEKRLDESEKQLVQYQQAIQAMNERQKTLETNIDKLAYPTAAPR
jgi:predicted  nucleic acid-binding Zn-ribbon protein